MLNDDRKWRLHYRWIMSASLAAAALVGVAAATCAAIARGLHPRSGWQGVYETRTGTAERRETQLGTAVVERHARETGESSFTATWRGYLIVPEAGEYRFVIHTTGQATLTLGRELAASTDVRGSGWQLRLTRGLNPIALAYRHGGTRPQLSLAWANGDGPYEPVPALLVIPELRAHDEVRRRVWIATSAPWLPVSALLILTGFAGLALRPFAARQSAALATSERHWLCTILAATAVLFAVGCTWGAPAIGSWAADEVFPSDVLDAVDRRFSGGWATLYPPLHYAVLAVVFVPFQLASVAGLTDLTSLPTWSHMLITSRLVSTAMALASIFLVFLITREQFGARAARFAALVAAAILPLTFYAKTTNLDAPYTFWMTLALFFYQRFFRGGRTADLVRFALAAAASIATKDQAYGFFVLPSAWMAVATMRYARRATRPAGAPSPKSLAIAGAAGIAALLVFYNVPFNPEGFVEHVRLIRGPASQNYRMFDRSPTGYASLVWTAFVQLGQAMSWPLFLAACAGVGTAVVSRAALSLPLLLPLVSYPLTFVGIVMYHYDRFFIGVALILSILAGWWLDGWTRRGVRLGRARLALVSAALVYALVRCLALDVLMLHDSRYAVEQALRAQAHPDRSIAAVGVVEYLPRPAFVPYRLIPQDFEAIASLNPDVLVANAAFSRREPPRREVYDALANGTMAYATAERYRTRLWWSPLQFEARFTQVVEDQFSNLTKVNPPIDVFTRRPRAGGAQRP